MSPMHWSVGRQTYGKPRGTPNGTPMAYHRTAEAPAAYQEGHADVGHALECGEAPAEEVCDALVRVGGGPRGVQLEGVHNPAGLCARTRTEKHAKTKQKRKQKQKKSKWWPPPTLVRVGGGPCRVQLEGVHDPAGLCACAWANKHTGQRARVKRHPTIMQQQCLQPYTQRARERRSLPLANKEGKR